VALKIELKPNERVMLGDCVVTNHDQRTRLTIDGKVTILRESDIMTLRQANTPAKRIYLAHSLCLLRRSRGTITSSIFGSPTKSSGPCPNRGHISSASIIGS
jgi:flagellar protein FlbT